MSGTTNAPAPLVFLHVGDLHITEAGLQNHLDFRRIVEEANAHLAGQIQFVVLPGDIADDGTRAQFALVSAELARLKTPWHAITGDHDFKQRSLENFYAGLGARSLPYACDVSGVRCIFLDVVSAGTGGPDFRLGQSQTAWFDAQMSTLRASGQAAIVFMHSYPSDLRDAGSNIGALIDGSPVVLVDMGHTHYNELSHDGRTIYAATRSTGQIEEGEVGYSLIAVDEGVVSWRFKTLRSGWPFAMITSPADRRLDLAESQPVASPVRAIAFGSSGAMRASVRIDDGPWQDMICEGGGRFVTREPLPLLLAPRKIAVRVVASDGASDTDTIEQAPDAIARSSSGSDAGAIGAWAERHLLGTQLGPNRNGRKW